LKKHNIDMTNPMKVNCAKRSILWNALGAVLVFCSPFSAAASARDKAATYQGPKGKLHVYLLIGQSNMAGRAPFTKEEAAPIERCYLLNGKDEWEPAKNPLNLYSTIRKQANMQKLNPGYGFSKAMLAKNPDIAVGLVVNAKGGTTIEQWEKGGKFYNEAVRRAKAAEKTGTLMGILWHQGESNSGGKSDGYSGKLKALVEGLRKDLDSPRLPFIAGQVNKVPEINEQIAKLPDMVPFTGFVGSEGLKTMDRWHFDAKSMKVLGERYAEKMLEVQGGQAKGGAR
jgi:hypothetical protein